MTALQGEEELEGCYHVEDEAHGENGVEFALWQILVEHPEGVAEVEEGLARIAVVE